MKSTNNTLTSYVASFVDELVRVGVNDVIISPGSRSTPMAILMAEHPTMNVTINIDERSAAFYALGVAKAKQKPVAILCTSGTAAANYFPAIVEAFNARIPLIVLTADRPHELRDVGAPQAIDQNQLYGNFAKWFVEMAIPEDAEQMLKYVRTVAGRAAGKAMSAPAGPVHLNFPFREPLVPNLEMNNLWGQGRQERTKHVNILVGKPKIDEDEIGHIVSIVKNVTKGLIVCGAHDDHEFVDVVTQLAEKLQFPIVADPLSQLRSGEHSKSLIIDGYDTILRNPEFCDVYNPELIIRFGAMPVSKALMQYIQKQPKATQIVVDGDGGWREPTLTATEMVYCDEVEFCNTLIKMTTEKDRSDWVDTWVHINNIVKESSSSIEDEQSLFEGRVFTELQEIIPRDATLFVGNSMPIRDLDTFFTNNEKQLKIMGNRGANGIDGIVSTALGVSSQNPHTILVIGDLSFYHDLNGLLAAKQHHLDITIVIINNDGGGIFSFLPQSAEEKHFEALFGTPIGLDYEHVVNMYGGTFNRVKNWEGFRTAINNSITSKGLSVVEVKTDRKENVAIHRKMWSKVSREINELIKKEYGNAYRSE
ncbi:2-succinyl-5-enolpyruvyl-6-hydroxy-3-cyclohexene-1-carboxylic-acid synthase [Fredinandcohnia quinoae]|uniref:2-succinyl-5-enolpyruvyl-6-hydroxy-3-cyclohexene-1-carboxylate synthase n=1 Tax=Fredinandcohnia quinoae TaxID=2918902 RepID=A0AAW5DZD2_9BACI|nr:2-succinyl-5-enolpyruvyl-6-hydroxy-3-cyclohexene-1-carboxylic-acid synthase [Fredinandcohnia sp. SECRCQ15]MCH1625438.1 2-succinyl-5-enolpyruvyl-6-hydroxy-3-cyclohexene-1-carboxylic-acid synthase [Fredinandcohnia sp. SECRCQ15]